MPQKDATPNRSQKMAIQAAGLDADEWVVVKELPSQLIIRNRHTNEHRLIDRKPKRLGK